MSSVRTREILADYAGLQLTDQLEDNPLGEVVVDTASNLALTEEQLRRAVDSLADRMSRVRQAIDNGRHVNERGEVQQLGNDVDRLCALRQGQLNTLKQLAGVYRKQAS